MSFSRKINYLINRWHHARYIVAFLGQGTISFVNFLVNIVLIRICDATEFGLFAFAVTLGHFAISVSNALAAAPRTFFGVPRNGRPSRFAVETLTSTIQFLIVGVALLTSFFLVTVFLDRRLSIGIGFSLYVASIAWRSYSRSFAYARLKPEIALAGDISLAVFSFCTLGAIILAGQPWALHIALFGLGASYIVAMAFETTLLRLGTRLALRWRSLRRYATIWPYASWMLVGSTTSIVQSQAHSFLVTGIAGTSALAPIAAGQVPFGPIRIINAAWHNVVIPEIVSVIGRGDRHGVIRKLWQSTLGLGLLVIMLGAALALSWDFVFAHLYDGKYEEELMRWMCLGWFVIVLLSTISSMPCAVLNALLFNRLLAIGTVYGSLISVASAFALIYLLSPAWSLLGVMAGETFLLIYAIFHLRRKLREWNLSARRS